MQTDLQPIDSKATADDAVRSRILLLSEIFPPAKGGSGRWFAELYPRLEEFDVTFMVGSHAQQDEVDCLISSQVIRADLGMKQRSVSNLNSLCRYATLGRQVRRFVSKNKIQEVHAARPLSEGLVARLATTGKRASYNCFVHGEDVSVAKTSRELTMVTNWVLRGARRIIANSINTGNLLREAWGISDEKLIVLNPGVDVDFFVPAQNPTSVRGELDWSNRKVLLTVGRLQQRKGQDMAIRAVAEVCKSHPEILYAVVGDGPDLESLKTLTQELNVADHVSFLGEINDQSMLKCYQACDYFALPNRTINGDIEGFGMVLVEAQACGKPVIAGKSGGTADTLAVGKTGELLDCTTPAELVQTLRTWLGNESIPLGMGAVAREFVVDRFSWKSLAARADQLFKQ